MKTSLPGPDFFDTRMVFRGYACLAALAGFALLVGPPSALATTVGSDPGGRLFVVRLGGGLFLGVACAAAGSASIEEPQSRHAALLWFLVATW